MQLKAEGDKVADLHPRAVDLAAGLGDRKVVVPQLPGCPSCARRHGRGTSDDLQML